MYSLDDNDALTPSNYYYRVVAEYIDGSQIVSDVVQVTVDQSDVTISHSVYPNPTIGDVMISYTVVKDETDVILSIYNSQGKMVLSNYSLGQNLNVGTYTHPFSTLSMEVGMYTVEIKIDDDIQVTKLIVID